MPMNDSQSKIFAIRISSESKRVYVRTRKTPFLLIALLFAIPWVLLAILYLNFISKQKTDISDGARSGPWGTARSYEFVTNPPSEFLTDELFPYHPAEWHFGSISRDALNKVFDTSGLPADQRTRILATAEVGLNSGWIVHPSDHDILNLPLEPRTALYLELAKVHKNQRQVDPFIFDPKQLDAWMADAQVPAAIVSTLQKLLYHHGNSVLLADAVTLMKTIPSIDDRRKVLNVLLRRSTVMLKLMRDSSATLAAQTRYWGVGDREKLVRPLLESLNHNHEGMIIDVALLLPRFARDRLYMYPRSNSSPIAMHRDCHWSAFNFFNDSPDDRFADPAQVKTELDANYALTTQPTQLGDIGMLTTSDNRIIHSCVYIADDFYFSKNGPSHISPWVLMRMADIKKLFPAYDNLTVQHYRMKKIAASKSAE